MTREGARNSSYQRGAFLRAQVAGTVPLIMLSSASPSRSAKQMCPITAIQMPNANQSCTNVAPVRQSSGNGSNHFMIDPVASITTAAPPRKVGVELLAGVELAEVVTVARGDGAGTSGRRRGSSG